MGFNKHLLYINQYSYSAGQDFLKTQPSLVHEVDENCKTVSSETEDRVCSKDIAQKIALQTMSLGKVKANITLLFHFCFILF